MPQDRPVPQYASHRPRFKGHDYNERGIYLITIVIAHRDPLFGSLNMDLLAEQICKMDVARTELSFRVVGR